MWGSEGIAPPFLASVLIGTDCSASRSCCFTVGDSTAVGGWVGPRAGLNIMEKRIFSCPRREPNLGHPTRSLAAIPTDISRLPNYFRIGSRTYLRCITLGHDQKCHYFCAMLVSKLTSVQFTSEPSTRPWRYMGKFRQNSTYSYLGNRRMLVRWRSTESAV
jgi:hypothetical protein